MVMISTSVEVVSRETIKPLCPTPNHLRNYILSSFDQNSPPIYIPVLLFYLNSANIITTNQKLCMLKKSLAECLSEYYPLAGIFRYDYSVVECNDEGAEFIEARVNFDISQIIGTSDVKLLNQLLPFEPIGNWSKLKGKPDEREVLVAAQANLFRCGGLVIGVCISHKIADGTSVVAFLNSWASKSLNTTTENANIVPPPILDSAKNFPPREVPRYSHDTGITNKTIVTKRFIFDSSSILALKKQARNAIIDSSDENIKFPTRVQAISALIWRRILALYRSKPKQAKICVSVHAVNIRPRMEPPVPNHTFGNYWTVAIAPAMLQTEQNAGDMSSDITILVEKLNKSIRNINADYVKKMNVVAPVSDSPKVHSFLKNGPTCDNNFKELEQHKSRLDDHSVETTAKAFTKGDLEVCNFTSWCRFPVYEVDFGWGKPEWVCTPIRSFKNLVILMGTKDGNGIEASVNLLEEDMPLFENDPEILSFAKYFP